MKNKTVSIILAHVFIVNTLSSSYGLAEAALKDKDNERLSKLSLSILPSKKFQSTMGQSPYTQNERDAGISYAQPQGAVFKIEATVQETEKDGKKDVTLQGQKVTLEPASDEATRKIYETYRPEVLREEFRRDREQTLKQLMWQSKSQRKGMREQGVDPKSWQASVLGHQIRRLPTETMMFFFAIGIINWGMLKYDFSQNPLIMEQHFQTLADPIGHLSFLSFMIVNGYTTEFLSNRMLAANLNAKIMADVTRNNMGKYMALSGGKFSPDDILKDSKNYADKIKTLNPYESSIAKTSYARSIQYLGMTAGSMASHFTGDFLRTMQSCVQSFYKEPKKGEQGAAALGQPQEDAKPTIKDRLNVISQDPCDVAWREWTLEKKFNQYSPALMSMILSTAGSGFLASQMKGIKESAFMQARKQGAKNVYVATYKLLGVDMATSLVARMLGGGGTMLMKWAGHLTNITIFTALDTLMHSWVEDKVLNFNYGTYSLFPDTDAFPKKAEILYNLVEKETKEKFSKDSPSCEKDIQSRDCRVNDIEGYMYNFSETMTKWREFNQTKPYQAHSQWIEKINKFQKLERFAFNFYRSFMTDLKQSRMCRDNWDLCVTSQYGELSLAEQVALQQKGIDPIRYEGATMSTYRQYPLYGVFPVMDEKVFKMHGWQDMYIGAPDRLQDNQKLRVNQVGATFEDYLKKFGIETSSIRNDKAKFEFIIKGLKSNDLLQMAQAIDYMRAIVNSGKNASDVTRAIVRDHLNLLGYAAPLLNYGQGFTFGFETNSVWKDAVQEVELPAFYRNWDNSSNIRYAKKTDYLIYHMLCGPSAEKGQSISNNTFIGISGFQDIFVPPRIINDSVRLDICGNQYGLDDSSKLYSQKIKDLSSGKEYSGAFHVIVENLKPELKEIVKSDKFDLTDDEFKKFKQLTPAEEASIAKLDDSQKALKKSEYLAAKRPEMLKLPNFNFDFWWEKYVEDKVQTQMDIFKVQYEEIAVKFLEAQFKGVGNLFGIPLNSEVVRNSIVVAAMQESRTYALIMAEVIKSILEPSEYQASLLDSKTIPGLTIRKLTNPVDILSNQVLPYQQDLNAIKTGSSPKLFKFQEMNEDILRDLYNTIRNGKVASKEDIHGKKRDIVDLGMNSAQIEEVEKKIDEKIKALEKETKAMIALVDKKVSVKDAKERAKPSRILEFGSTQLARIAQELVGTLGTIRYAQMAAENYSKKDLTTEEQKKVAERQQREEANRKCVESKRMGTSTAGGCK